MVCLPYSPTTALPNTEEHRETLHSSELYIDAESSRSISNNLLAFPHITVDPVTVGFEAKRSIGGTGFLAVFTTHSY